MIIKHGNSDLNFNNIITGKWYKNWREMCKVLDIDYKKSNGNKKQGVIKRLEVEYEIIKKGYKMQFNKLPNKIIEKNKDNLFIKRLSNRSEKYKNIFMNILYLITIYEYDTYDINISVFYKHNLLNNELINIDNNYTDGNKQRYIKETLMSSIENAILNIKRNNIMEKHKNIIELIRPKQIVICRDSIKKYKFITVTKFPKNIIFNKTHLEYNPRSKNGHYKINESHRNYKVDKINKYYYKNKIIEYCKYIQLKYPHGYYIYMYKHKETEQTYIGYTSNLSSRQESRFYNPSTPFDYSIRAIGANGFTFAIIDFAEEKSKALKIESCYIKKYNSINNGYNMVK